MSIANLQAYYGFSRTPFGRDLAPGMLHRHQAHNEAVARIKYCIAERFIGVVTGEVGAGKSLPDSPLFKRLLGREHLLQSSCLERSLSEINKCFVRLSDSRVVSKQCLNGRCEHADVVCAQDVPSRGHGAAVNPIRNGPCHPMPLRAAAAHFNDGPTRLNYEATEADQD